jgi:hypothetical protein
MSDFLKGNANPRYLGSLRSSVSHVRSNGSFSSGTSSTVFLSGPESCAAANTVPVASVHSNPPVNGAAKYTRAARVLVRPQTPVPF